jgi:uncharacterized protein (TIGR00255 family)
MAVYSMTGFAHGQSTPQIDTEAPAAAAFAPRLSVEVRAVNSRFLDLSFRLPDELRLFEPQLRDLLGGKIRRGKVELRANIERSDTQGLPDPSPQLLHRLSAQQDQIKAWLPEARPLSVADVLRLGAGGSGAHSVDSEAFLALAQRTLQDFLAAREREGAKLVAMLQERISALQTLAAAAEPLVPQVVEQQRQRFLERFSEALKLADATTDASSKTTQASLEQAQTRALAEATAFAIRLDVAEEVSRLRAHLSEMERLLQKGGDVGKRLDFLIQELHREANTLGSKSGALELTQISVEMKVLIEQMREQVQNIE